MNLYTYSGQISYPTGAPTIQDIAVSLSREGRYAGAGLYWWPVALHTFVVCDLLPPELKLHGLLHDASECITGDIPKPAKTPALESLENEILARIYASLGLAVPTRLEDLNVHEADRRALYGEVWTVGTLTLRSIYPQDYEAERIVWQYFKRFKPEECLKANGSCVEEFQKRFGEYREMVK